MTTDQLTIPDAALVPQDKPDKPKFYVFGKDIYTQDHRVAGRIVRGKADLNRLGMSILSESYFPR